MKKKKEIKKENSQFKHPLPKGWLQPYLLALSDIFDGRWSYWLNILQTGKPLPDPIPRINFDSHPHNDVQKNLKDCISYVQSKGYGSEAWMMFVDWLLWGFGSKLVTEWPERITEEISWYWYQTFNLGLMMLHPADHMAWGACELSGHSGLHGYFPTPMHICQMMADIQMSDDKTKTVNDPCVGTGSMLLAASNYSLRLSGQDISLDMVKMLTVNGFIFVPWLVMSGDGLIDWHSMDDYRKAVMAFENWQAEITNHIKLITYQLRSNTLSDWI